MTEVTGESKSLRLSPLLLYTKSNITKTIQIAPSFLLFIACVPTQIRSAEERLSQKSDQKNKIQEAEDSHRYAVDIFTFL